MSMSSVPWPTNAGRTAKPATGRATMPAVTQLPITSPTSATVNPTAKPSGHRLGAGPWSGPVGPFVSTTSASPLAPTFEDVSRELAERDHADEHEPDDQHRRDHLLALLGGVVHGLEERQDRCERAHRAGIYPTRRACAARALARVVASPRPPPRR